MKIGLFGTYNTSDTGPSRVTEGLASGLAKLGHDVEMLTHGDRSDPPHENINVTQLSETPESIFGFSRLYNEVRKHANQANYDIFHPLEDYYFPADVRTVQWLFTSIDLLRDPQFPGSNLPWKAIAGEVPLYMLSGIGCRLSEQVVAQSSVTAEQMRRYWKQEPDSIIPLGIESEYLTEPTEQEGKTQVLFVGRITPKKGQKRVLEYLSPRSSTYDVDIVGEKADDEYYDQLGDWKEHCQGFVDRHELEDYYKSADIVVVPSYHENFGITAIEGIAHGCIVIVSDRCGFATFDWANVENGIYTFSDGKIAAEKIVELSTQDLTERRSSAYELAQDLTWENIANTYIQVYQDSI